MEVLAYLNHGYWKVDCPNCGKAGASLAQPAPALSPFYADREFVCPNCYPGMVAGTRRGNTFEFNAPAQAAAHQQAEKNGHMYLVVFPAEKAEIEQIVSHRPRPNQNWEPGESLDFLREENAERGIK